MIQYGDMNFKRAIQIIDDFLKESIITLWQLSDNGEDFTIPESSCNLTELQMAYDTLRTNYNWSEELQRSH